MCPWRRLFAENYEDLPRRESDEEIDIAQISPEKIRERIEGLLPAKLKPLTDEAAKAKPKIDGKTAAKQILAWMVENEKSPKAYLARAGFRECQRRFDEELRA